MQHIAVHLGLTVLLLSLKSGVGHNIVLHASSTARNFPFLTSAFSVHAAFFFFFLFFLSTDPLHTYWCIITLNQRFTCNKLSFC